MQVIKTLPIARGGKLEELSYFSSRAYLPGTVVSIPVRNRRMPAVVLESLPAEDAKMQVRRGSFALKRIGQSAGKRVFSAPFLDMVREAAAYHAGGMSETLYALTSLEILGSASRVSEARTAERASTLLNEEFLLQSPAHERIADYKSHVRASFARGASIFILVPTVQDGEKIFSALEKGIEGRVVFLHGAIAKQELVRRWNAAVGADEPMLVIGTGSFLSLPLAKLGTLIIERESSSAYVSLSRPYVDYRLCAAILAGKVGAKLLIGDFPIRTETLFECKSRKGVCEELSPLKARLPLTARVSVIDTRKSPTNEAKRFTTVSEELAHAIERTRSAGAQAFVFAARRGLSPLTVCNDCGSPLSEPESGLPMVLHKTAAGNVFISHASGIVKDSRMRCPACDSWNLISLGVGIQRVEEELAQRFGKDAVMSLDRDSAKTHRAARERAARFYDTPGSILIGTEMAIPYLEKRVALAAVASLDSLLSFPEWRAEERSFGVLMNLRALASDELAIQTRHSDERIIRFAKDADTYGLYKEELERREKFGYPPYAIFISLSWQGSRAAVEGTKKELVERFKNYEIISHVPPLALPAKTGCAPLFRARALIRIERDAWPNPQLSALLSGLSPAIAIQVNPQELL